MLYSFFGQSGLRPGTLWGRRRARASAAPFLTAFFLAVDFAAFDVAPRDLAACRYSSSLFAADAVSDPASGDPTVASDAAPDASAPTVAGAPSAGPYHLKYKFARGESLRYEVNHSTNVRTTIEGKTQQLESESKSVKVWKVTDVLPDGTMEFVHMVDSVIMTNHAPGGAVNRFDSSEPGEPAAGFEQAASAVGIPLSLIRIAAHGKIVHREEKHPQPVASDDLPITLTLADRLVAVGETWDMMYDVPVEQKGGARLQVKTRRLCRLKGVVDQIAEIDVEYQILSPVDAFVKAQLVERITKGTVRFDIEKGRVVSQQHDVDARILGFAGQVSSMHFMARTQERLLSDEATLANPAAPAKVAARP